MKYAKIFEFDDMTGGYASFDAADFLSFSLPAASLRFAKRDIINYNMIPYNRAQQVQQPRTVQSFTSRWDTFKDIQIGNRAQGIELDTKKTLLTGKVLRVNKNQDGSKVESYTILDEKTGTKKQIRGDASVKIVPESRGTGRLFGGMTLSSNM